LRAARPVTAPDATAASAQFEVLAKLSELWRSRVDGCPDAPVLEYVSSAPGADDRPAHIFRLASGALDVAADKDRTFFDFLLAADDNGDDDSDSALPPEALFDDLALMGVVFPLNRWTRPRWDAQPGAVRRGVRIADVRDIAVDGGAHTRVELHTWPAGAGALALIPGRRYRLSPRLVDFNVAKVLSTLLELDLRWAARASGDADADGAPPFLRLISDPASLALEKGPEGEAVGQAFLQKEHVIQRTFKQLADLGSGDATTLLLKPSQRHAARRMLTHRLAVIWGPPGAGKTHTIASSLLRLLECQSGTAPPQIIFLAAMTHAAIDACLSKLRNLTGRSQSLRGLPTAWLDKVKIEHVLKGSDHPLPARTTSNTYIYAGTVYQV
jgi:hypothetical protein